MITSCRLCWRNCALNADSEIMAIDGMEDHIADDKRVGHPFARSATPQ
jgi:hypothetical protein